MVTGVAFRYTWAKTFMALFTNQIMSKFSTPFSSNHLRARLLKKKKEYLTYSCTRTTKSLSLFPIKLPPNSLLHLSRQRRSPTKRKKEIQLCVDIEFHGCRGGRMWGLWWATARGIFLKNFFTLVIKPSPPLSPTTLNTQPPTAQPLSFYVRPCCSPNPQSPT